MAPRATSADSGGRPKVSGVSTAIAMVAVSPGSAPMIVPATTPPTASSRWNGESAASRWERISMEFSWRVLRAGSPGRPRHDRSRYEPDSPGKCPGESGSQAIAADLLNQVDFLADRHGLLAELLQIGRAPVCTPITNAHIICRHLLEKKQQTTH